MAVILVLLHLLFTYDRLVPGLGRGGGLSNDVTFAEFAVEEIEDEAVEAVGEFWVVANAFVTHEGVSAVDLVPGEAGAKFVETGEDGHAAFGGDVGVLTAPNHEELAFDFSGTLE